VGLRHPDVFTAIAARNCNFNRPNTDGWYPPEAKHTRMLIYYGSNDPATIVGQSRQAVRYFRERGFSVETRVVSGAGHERKPEVAMAFFTKHKRPPRPSVPP
jgi:predicted esterase